MSNTAKIFKNLRGNWTIERTIDNQGRMNGIAWFRNSNNEQNTLHYREEGVFTLNSGRSCNIYREYVYRFQNNNISAYFVENGKTDRLFHILEFDSPALTGSTMKAKAKHICRCDTYDVIYEFYSDNAFNIIYQVKGPLKNYVSSTFFKRS